MENLKCQICSRTYKEITKRKMGFYFNNKGDKLCLTCKEIKEKNDKWLINIFKENQQYKEKYEELKNFIINWKYDYPFIFKKLQEIENIKDFK